MRLSGHCNISPSGPLLTWFTNPVGTWLVPGTGGHGQQEDPEPHPHGDYHPLIKPCPFSMAPPNAATSRKPSRITQLFRELLPLTLFVRAQAAAHPVLGWLCVTWFCLPGTSAQMGLSRWHELSPSPPSSRRNKVPWALPRPGLAPCLWQTVPEQSQHHAGGPLLKKAQPLRTSAADAHRWASWRRQRLVVLRRRGRTLSEAPSPAGTLHPCLGRLPVRVPSAVTSSPTWSDFHLGRSQEGCSWPAEVWAASSDPPLSRLHPSAGARSSCAAGRQCWAVAGALGGRDRWLPCPRQALHVGV